MQSEHMEFGDPRLPWLRHLAEKVGRALTLDDIEKARKMRVQGAVLNAIAHELTAQPTVTGRRIETTLITTPEHILKALRQREGLAADDSQHDTKLSALPPLAKLRAIALSELGDSDWADQFITWAKQCGITIEDPRD